MINNLWNNHLLQESLSGLMGFLLISVTMSGSHQTMMMSLIIWIMMQGKYFVSETVLSSAPSIAYKLLQIIICLATKMITNWYINTNWISGLEINHDHDSKTLTLLFVIVVLVRCLSLPFHTWILKKVNLANDSLSRIIFVDQYVTFAMLLMIVIPCLLLFTLNDKSSLTSVYLSSACVIIIPTGSLHGNATFTILHCVAMMIMIISTTFRITSCSKCTLTEYITTINMICYLIGFSTVCEKSESIQTVIKQPATPLKQSQGKNAYSALRDDVKKATDDDKINVNKIRVKNEVKSFVCLFELTLVELLREGKLSSLLLIAGR
jgi:hypothetical protein